MAEQTAGTIQTTKVMEASESEIAQAKDGRDGRWLGISAGSSHTDTRVISFLQPSP